MNNRGIVARVLIMALLPLVLAAGGLSWFFIQARHGEIDDALNDRARVMATQLAKSCEYALFAGQHDELERLAAPLYRQPEVQMVAVADAGREYLLHLGDPPVDFQAPDGETVVVRADALSLLVVSPVRHRADASTDVYLDPTPNVLGYVVLRVTREPTLQRQRDMLWTGLAFALLGVLLAGLLAWRLGRDIVRPIAMLTGAVQRLGAGDLTARVRVDTGGEFALLEQGFNRMAQELKASYDNLHERVRTATAQLSWQASHDALTGLLNRTGFDEALHRLWQDARDAGERHCLLYIDLDQFKVVNDTSGHQAGDELLRQLATLMRHNLRASDVLGRLGGDEFGVLLAHCDAATGEQLGDKLRRVIKAYRYAHGERLYQVGASIGLVEIDASWTDPAQVMSAADAACYAAKDAGRDMIRRYHPGDEEVARRRGEMDWLERLKRAMREQHLLLYAQPIVALGDDGLAPHYELLLRLREGDSGDTVLPMAFIPAAERYQLMPLIDRWVIEHALDMCERGIANGSLDARVVFGINLSGATLSEARFQSYVRARLRDHPAAAAHVCFEITETAAISNMDTAQALIEDLKALGCHFALDDFGSGLSSFAYLRTLAVDYIKIDGAFVRDMVRDAVDAAMVEAIVRVARIMGIRTVAEFVEDGATAAALRALGVDYGQGNHFAAPRPLTQVCGVPARDAAGAGWSHQADSTW